MELSSESESFLRETLSKTIPFHVFLGLRIDALRHGFARLHIPFRPEFIGDPARPALHGGIISTLLDSCGGAAAWSTVTVHDRISTVDLRVDYLRPGRSEDLWSEASVIRAGNRVVVVNIRVFHTSAPEETLADGKAVYNIKRGHSEAKLP